jgi:fructose-1,6-bisphosphatase/inositol monophosphatase family enzyme
MPSFDHAVALRHLKHLQAKVRDLIVESRGRADLAGVDKTTDADTIYAIDAVVEPAILEVCRAWAQEQPMVLISEGLEREDGTEGPIQLGEGEPIIRVLLDPIDGTRGIMYDKRPAWSLGGVAPDRGEATTLRDVEVAVMTELPTAKMGQADVLWATAGGGAHGERVTLATNDVEPLPLRPSGADGINHGFAQISNFFPGTKVLASRLMEELAAELIGPADVTRATVFDDQYISTGGQWYELIVGHDRFNADLRPLFYQKQGQPEGLCCHPYDCVTWLVAEEAGVVLTDEQGGPLDGPLDTTSGVNWIGYANEQLRKKIQPLLREKLEQL